MRNVLKSSFTIEYPNGTGYFTFMPEVPDLDLELLRQSRFLIYCMHPKGGTCEFTAKVNENNECVYERSPDFIDYETQAVIEKHILAFLNAS